MRWHNDVFKTYVKSKSTRSQIVAVLKLTFTISRVILILIVFNSQTNITISNTTSSVTRFPYFPYYTLYYLAQRLSRLSKWKRQTDEVDMKKVIFIAYSHNITSRGKFFARHDRRIIEKSFTARWLILSRALLNWYWAQGKRKTIQ